MYIHTYSASAISTPRHSEHRRAPRVINHSQIKETNIYTCIHTYIHTVLPPSPHRAIQSIAGPLESSIIVKSTQNGFNARYDLEYRHHDSHGAYESRQSPFYMYIDTEEEHQVRGTGPGSLPGNRHVGPDSSADARRASVIAAAEATEKRASPRVDHHSERGNHRLAGKDQTQTKAGMCEDSEGVDDGGGEDWERAIAALRSRAEGQLPMHPEHYTDDEYIERNMRLYTARLGLDGSPTSDGASYKAGNEPVYTYLNVASDSHTPTHGAADAHDNITVFTELHKAHDDATPAEMPTPSSRHRPIPICASPKPPEQMQVDSSTGGTSQRRASTVSVSNSNSPVIKSSTSAAFRRPSSTTLSASKSPKFAGAGMSPKSAGAGLSPKFAGGAGYGDLVPDRVPPMDAPSARPVDELGAWRDS
jgi:hypothetical protein